MAKHVAPKKTRTIIPGCSKEEVRRRNREAVKLLDEWMSTPDDKGDEWWDKFEADLKADRFTLRRGE